MSSTTHDSPDCWPLSLTRKIEDFPIGNLPLRDHQERVLLGLELSCLSKAWLDLLDVADFMASGKKSMVDPEGVVLAWKGDGADGSDVFLAKASFVIRYPWDLIRANELHVGSIGECIIQGEIHPLAVVDGMLNLGPGSRILPGVVIEGNVVIGANCKIGPNCYLRGHTSIGDGCHIGQSVEIKNSLILSGTNVGHLSYVGDSVLGEKVNLGAGTMTSNLRHDGKNHRSMVGGVLVDTGRRKFGAIFGDGAHTGINTSIYPGRKLWPNTSTRPAGVVQYDLNFS